VLDEDKVRATFERLIAEHFLAVNDGPEGIDGGLAGMLTEFWFSRERLACDLAFFVRPSRRGSIAAVRLVQAFVAWARERGAAEVSISQSRAFASRRRTGCSPAWASPTWAAFTSGDSAMCDPATAMMIGSTGMKVVGGIMEGQQQKAFYNYSADQANADADYERGMGAVRAEKTRKAGRYAKAR
jgi:GNAT superfamily N-acetyltransferase